MQTRRRSRRFSPDAYAATVLPGSSATFNANVSGTSNTAVTWSIDQGAAGGQITQQGGYTAPHVTTASTFTVRATSVEDPSKSGTATVQVPPGCEIYISPPSATIWSSRTVNLIATTTNCSDPTVSWSVQNQIGLVSPNGNTATYLAPKVMLDTTAVVVASNTEQQAMAQISIKRGEPPTVASVSPLYLQAKRQMFTVVASDLQGFDDLATIQLAFITAGLTSDWAGQCFLYASVDSDPVALALSTGSGSWVYGTIGEQGTLANSHCTVHLPSSSTSASGTSRTLLLDIDFNRPSSPGKKYVYSAASDLDANYAYWQVAGEWTVPGEIGQWTIYDQSGNPTSGYYNKAQLVSFSAPAQVAPGQSFQSTVKMKNTGTVSWQSNSINPLQPHRLGSTSPDNNTTWGLSRLELAGEVPPGQDATFVINASAPANPGDYTFAWGMVQDSVQRFVVGSGASSVASAPIKVTLNPYPESSHPYGNNANETAQYVHTGSCASLSVTFASQTQMLSGDYVYVMDGNDVNIAGSPFTGTTLGSQTVSVPGSTLKVRLTSNSSGTAWGYRVTNIACIPPAPGAGTYDNFSPHISYNPLGWPYGWHHDTQFPQTSNQSLTYADQAGSSAQFTFYGGAISYVFTKAFNRGIANVYIDGQLAGTVDLYSPSTQWQQGAFFGGYSYGNHTIRIEVSGDKHPSSQGTFVDLDHFIVY